MKVLFLTPWYPDDPKLQGIFIRDQAIALSQHHEVFLISSKIDNSSFGFLSFKTVEGKLGKIREHRLTIKRSIPGYNQINYFLVTIWYTWMKTRTFKPDIIHGNIGYPGAFWAWTASKMLNVPYVMTEHSTRYANHLRSLWHRLLAISFMRKATTVIAVSKNSAEDIGSHIKKQPIIIPNLIRVENFSSLVTPPVEAVWQIGFLGGLDYDRKGLDILMKALAQVSLQFVLHVGGSGRLLNEYKQLAQDVGIAEKCRYYGFLQEGKVPEFMSRLHFFVSASRAEGFGMVIAEAMACGLPVIATRSGGPDDFVNSGNGLLIPANDVERLSESIIWTMENYNSFDRTAIKSFIVEHYSPEVIAAKISAVYSEALQR